MTIFEPRYPPSLIRVFAVRMKKAWDLSYPLSTQRRLWLDRADDQADLSLRWAHSHFVSFIMRRLILLYSLWRLDWVREPLWERFKGWAQYHFFSEFEPQQNLDLSQISFDNLIGYTLSIPMCMQNFITIFFTVLQIGPFSLFRIWSSAKPRPIKDVISQSLGLELVNINVYAKVYQNIPLSSRDRAIFTFSEFGSQQSLDRW